MKGKRCTCNYLEKADGLQTANYANRRMNSGLFALGLLQLLLSGRLVLRLLNSLFVVGVIGKLVTFIFVHPGPDLGMGKLGSCPGASTTREPPHIS